MAITSFIHSHSDPQIKKRQDRHGNTYYQVYDPQSRRSTSFGSEAEVRYWIEQRYSR
ncbi:hypothetical protein [Lyngbya confervoides]|uniref:Integrase n=1 Tax=Lyngbya confervoides BDU141951 TaxID=1574623 RepID=A0ABD4T6K8_9CYAN|nr:hypothetical protein [Lyngbya confervoides]MCM1983892.1 hypothetical protein [Lyngbya confervoides BDU141951]